MLSGDGKKDRGSGDENDVSATRIQKLGRKHLNEELEENRSIYSSVPCQ